MEFITMWRRGAHKCILVIGGDHMQLRLVGAASIVREQVVTVDAAALLADLWRSEESQDMWHNSTLALA
jgi:hypothetical protein